MTSEEKKHLKDLILKRYQLYLLQGSRLKRFLKDPVRTLTYYTLQWCAYRRPFKVKYTTLWGDSMSFYLPEAGMLYYYGFFEANLSNFFINFLEQNDVFIDVGAHVGYYTVLAEALLGKGGAIHSFEPTPRTFKSLFENTRNAKNITIHNKAILNEETTIEFFDYGPKYSAFNSFKKRTGEEIFFRNDVEKIRVETISLDTYCASNNVTPTLIKIDAEGSEYLILEAMNHLLKEVHPSVTLEVSDNKEWQEGQTKAITILTSHGYMCFEITLQGELIESDPWKVRKYDNLLFVHPTKIERITKLIVTL